MELTKPNVLGGLGDRYYTTREIAKETEIKEKKISYTITELVRNKVIKSKKNENGINIFSKKDVDLIKIIAKHVDNGASPMNAYNYFKGVVEKVIYKVSKKEILEQISESLKRKITMQEIKEAIKDLSSRGYRWSKIGNTKTYVKEDIPILQKVIEEKSKEPNFIVQINFEIQKIRKKLNESQREIEGLDVMIDQHQSIVNSAKEYMNLKSDNGIFENLVSFYQPKLEEELSQKGHKKEEYEKQKKMLMHCYEILGKIEKLNEEKKTESIIDENVADYEKMLIEERMAINGLSKNEEKIIKMIGITGISRNKEMNKFMNETESIEKLNQQELSSAIKKLLDTGLLQSETVKLSTKGGYNFVVYELTELGRRIYKKMTGEKPKSSEKEKMLEQHNSLEKGYLIKESELRFKELGYEFQELRKNELDTVEFFDLIIKKGEEKKHIKVLLKTEEDEFFKMMNRMIKTTNEVYIICQNQAVLCGNVKVLFFKWIKEFFGSIKNAKGQLKTYFTTFDEIKKNKILWDCIDF